MANGLFKPPTSLTSCMGVSAQALVDTQKKAMSNWSVLDKDMEAFVKFKVRG